MFQRVEQVEHPLQSVITVRATCAQTDLATAIPDLLNKAGSVLTECGLEMAGPPFTRYLDWRESDCDIESGCPIVSLPELLPDGVFGGRIGGRTILKATFQGPYSGLPAAWEAFYQEFRRAGGDFAEDCWEVYETDPSLEPDPARWLTALCGPLPK